MVSLSFGIAKNDGCECKNSVRLFSFA